MSDYDINRRWSDKFIPYIADRIGRVLIAPAPYEEDSQRNTDLIVLKLDAVRIGCRIRRPGYTEKFANEFTIRCNLPSGNKTELTKIIEGWGDYFFYGFANSNETDIERWTLADLNVFRLWFNVQLAKQSGKAPGALIPNIDGSSEFRAFKWSDLPDNFIVDSSDKRRNRHV
jgi:hypothetical protein